MKQNIVYFAADQMRADTLHHLGNPASHTPHLDGAGHRKAFPLPTPSVRIRYAFHPAAAF